MQAMPLKAKAARRYLLKEVDGAVVRMRDLTAVQLISAKPGCSYTLIDAETMLPVETVTGKKNKTTLELFVGEEKVGELGNFFVPPAATEGATVAFAPLAFFDPVNNLAIASETSESGFSLFGLGLGGMGVSALGAGGLLVASALGNKSASASSAGALLGSLKGAVTAGTMVAGSVTIKAYDTKGNELGSTVIGENGLWEIKDARLNGYKGSVLLVATDANGNAVNYLDEATGSQLSLGTSLRSVAVLDGTSDVLVSITPATELAVRTLAISETVAPPEVSVQAIRDQLKALLNVPFDLLSVIPVPTNSSAFNPDNNATLSDAEKYGILLAKLSGLDAVNEGNMNASLTALSAAISVSVSGGNAELQLLIEQGRQAALEAMKAAPSTAEKTFFIDTPLARYLLGEVVIDSQTIDAQGKLRIKGTALPNTQVSITFPDGEKVSAITDGAGKFVVAAPSAVTVGNISAVSSDALGAPVSKDVVLDTQAPSVVSFSPQAGSAGVAPNAPIVIQFSEPVVRGVGTIYLRKNSAIGPIVEAFDLETSNRLNFIGDTLTLTPTSALSSGTTYVLTGKSETSLSGITDTSGNALMTQTQAYAFTTGADTGTEPTISEPISVAVTTSKTTLLANESLGVLFELSEPSNDFTVGDVSVSGGALSQFTKLTETVYTAVFTPVPGAMVAFLSVDSKRFQNVSETAWNLDGTDADNSLVFSIQAASTPTTSTDLTPPIALQFNPANGAQAAAVDGNIYIGFSEAIQRGLGSIQIRSGSLFGPVVESFDMATSARVVVNGNALLIDPTTSLAAGTRYFVSLDPGSVKDMTGNLFAGTSSYEFTTATANSDTTAPNAPSSLDLLSSSDSGTSNTDNITNKTTPVVGGTAEALSTVKLYDTDGVTQLGQATAGNDGAWTITSSQLAAGVHTLTAKATDSAGNTSAASQALSVTIDAAAPTVATFSPADAATGVDAGTSVSFTFSEPIAKGSGLIELRKGSATGEVVESFDVQSSTGLLANGNLLTLEPSATLLANTKYFVTVANGAIVDLAGNAFGGTTTYDFTTGAEQPAPIITKISSDLPDKQLCKGDVITIDVDFDQVVFVDEGTFGPTLAFNSGGLASYQLGSGTHRLTFTYVVEKDEETNHLAVNAFVMNDAYVKNEQGVDINDAVDVISGGNLDANKHFVVDGNPPDIVGMSLHETSFDDGVSSGVISVYFDQAVVLGELPTGRMEAFLGLSGISEVDDPDLVPIAVLNTTLVDSVLGYRPSNVLYFTYQGRPDFGSAADIEVTAFASNNRAITDHAGNLAVLGVDETNNILGSDNANLVQLTAAAGPFGDGALEVRVLDELGTLAWSTQMAGNKLTLNAQQLAQLGSGWKILELYDSNAHTSDYLDEYSGVAKSLAGDDAGFGMRTFFEVDHLGALVVSPLTELATRLALKAGGGVLGEDAFSVAQAVSQLFAVDDVLKTPVTFSNSDAYKLSDGLTPSEAYGQALAVLSAADALTGSMSATIEYLSQHLTFDVEQGQLSTDDSQSLQDFLRQAGELAGQSTAGWAPHIDQLAMGDSIPVDSQASLILFEDNLGDWELFVAGESTALLMVDDSSVESTADIALAEFVPSAMDVPLVAYEDSSHYAPSRH
jgi:methionine-rich copper-binding protein CopC